MVTKKKKDETPKESFIVPVDGYIETGCVGIDMELSNGKGIPVGSNILLFANPGTGKTTIIADILTRVMKKYEMGGVPFRAVYLDSENSLSLLKCMGKDPKNPEELGLEKYITVATSADKPVEYLPQQLIYYPNITTFTEAEMIYKRYTLEDKVKENQDVRIIIVDSLTNLVSSVLKEAEVDKADFGSNAKERSRFYGKWLGCTRERGIVTIYTSQVRQKQGANPYEDPNRPAVTECDKHNMDIIMKLTKSTDSKRTVIKKVQQKTISGVVEIQPRCLIKLDTKKDKNTKNRYWDAVEVEILLKYGCKVLNAYTVFRIFEENGIFRKINATTYSVIPEFANNFQDLNFGTLEEGISKKELNELTSFNLGRFVEYMKLNGIYQAKIGEEEEIDDGLFN